MEVRTLQIKDIDLNRRMVHVRQSKGKKDRYVPMGCVLADGISKYLDAERPVKWLFNGKGDPTIEGRKGGRLRQPVLPARCTMGGERSREAIRY